MNLFLVCLLVTFGVALMVLEMFFIPGFGMAGVAAFVVLGSSVGLAYTKLGALAGNITLIAVLILLIIAIWWFLSGKTFERLSLKAKVSEKVDLTSGMGLRVGDVVKTSSRLAPMGKIVANNQEFEAKSTGEFIDQEVSVEIVRIEGNTVLVKPLKEA